jgi:hypothetical protein
MVMEKWHTKMELYTKVIGFKVGKMEEAWRAIDQGECKMGIGRMELL